MRLQRPGTQSRFERHPATRIVRTVRGHQKVRAGGVHQGPASFPPCAYGYRCRKCFLWNWRPRQARARRHTCSVPAPRFWFCRIVGRDPALWRAIRKTRGIGACDSVRCTRRNRRAIKANHVKFGYIHYASLKRCGFRAICANLTDLLSSWIVSGFATCCTV